MIRLFVLPVLIASLFADDGPQAGRKGNELYKQKKYAEAAQQYQSGIAGMKPEANPNLSGLYNNLASAYYRQNQFDKAQEAYERAIFAASSKPQLSNAAYNAGNAFTQNKQLEQALNAYRQALAANPNNENARYNYEYVKRQLQQQQNQQQNKQDQKQNQQQQQNQNQQQNQDQNQDQQQQQQNQNQQQQNEQNDQNQKPQPSKPRPDKQISKEEAQRILDAMKNDEQRLLQELRKKSEGGRNAEKDW